MENLLDVEEYNFLYFSNNASHTKYPKKFDFKKFRKDKIHYLDGLNDDFRELMYQLLLHYLSIVMGVYGREFIEHIPKEMRLLLRLLYVETIYPENKCKYFFSSDTCYKRMIKNPKRYECSLLYEAR